MVSNTVCTFSKIKVVINMIRQLNILSNTMDNGISSPPPSLPLCDHPSHSQKKDDPCVRGNADCLDTVSSQAQMASCLQIERSFDAWEGRSHTRKAAVHKPYLCVWIYFLTVCKQCGTHFIVTVFLLVLLFLRVWILKHLFSFTLCFNGTVGSRSESVYVSILHRYSTRLGGVCIVQSIGKHSLKPDCHHFQFAKHQRAADLCICRITGQQCSVEKKVLGQALDCQAKCWKLQWWCSILGWKLCWSDWLRGCHW